MKVKEVRSPNNSAYCRVYLQNVKGKAEFPLKAEDASAISMGVSLFRGLMFLFLMKGYFCLEWFGAESMIGWDFTRENK